MKRKTAIEQLRTTLSAPATLLLATGVGFMVGYFNPAQKAKRAASKATKVAWRASVLASLAHPEWIMALLSALKVVEKPPSSDADDL